MKPVRVAVVGLGAVAQSVHLPVVQRNRADVDLVALAEVSPSRRAVIGSRYGVPDSGWFATAHDLATAMEQGRISVDAAVIATPGNHAEEALALIRAGARVLAEKPLAHSFLEVDELAAGLTQLGRDPHEWLRVGYMKEHDPAVAAARDLLATTVPREVSVEVLHPADATQLRFAQLEPPVVDVKRKLTDRAEHRLQHSISAAVGSVDTTWRKLYSSVVLGSIIHDIALARHLDLALVDVSHAMHLATPFPGSVIAAGFTAERVPFNIAWHFIKDYPEYREKFTIHHERGSVELEFTTPYILNSPTILRSRSSGEDLHGTQRPSARFPSAECATVWPQEEAFERQFRSLVAMTRDRFSAGSSIDAARNDLVSAQTLWRGCAVGAGIALDPACEVANRRQWGATPDGEEDSTA